MTFFTWAGRLWLVDCKDRKPAEDLADALKPYLGRPLPQDASYLFDRIREELFIGQSKAIKEDLVAVREVAGLLGNVVCVRQAGLRAEVLQYARNNGIAVVQKRSLVQDLRSLLLPNEPASLDQLRHLAAVRTRATA